MRQVAMEISCCGTTNSMWSQSPILLSMNVKFFRKSVCCKLQFYFWLGLKQPCTVVAISLRLRSENKVWKMPRFHSGSHGFFSFVCVFQLWLFLSSMGGLWGGKCDVNVRFNYILQGNQKPAHGEQPYSRD